MPNRLLPCACALLLCGDVAVAAAMDYPPSLGDLRMNQIQVVGTHNSYHEQPSMALDTVMVAILNQVPEAREDLCPADPDADSCIQRFRYTHESLTTQLEDFAIRQFELDVFGDPDGGLYQAPLGWRFTNDDPPPPFDPALVPPGFKVLHVQDLDFRTTCFTFQDCLIEIRDWSLANPDHIPILVLVEAKDDILPPFEALPPFAIPPPFDAEMFDALDAEILSVFDPEHLLLPEDVKGVRPTLREAVQMDGWPTLDEARGLVYFALDNGGSKRADYLSGHPSLTGRVMFTDSPSNADEAAFIKRNDPYAADIPSLIEQGFLVRTRADAETQEALANDTTRRDAAFASGANFISTDYPVPDDDLSPYVVEFEGGLSFRCNPLNTEPPCSFVPEPSLAILQVFAVATLARGRTRKRAGRRGSMAAAA